MVDLQPERMLRKGEHDQHGSTQYASDTALYDRASAKIR